MHYHVDVETDYSDTTKQDALSDLIPEFPQLVAWKEIANVSKTHRHVINLQYPHPTKIHKSHPWSNRTKNTTIHSLSKIYNIPITSKITTKQLQSAKKHNLQMNTLNPPFKSSKHTKPTSQFLSKLTNKHIQKNDLNFLKKKLTNHITWILFHSLHHTHYHPLQL